MFNFRVNLLPIQQHGFRKGRSTTTALASMVADWSSAYEDGLSTGVLLWDLSSAFDTIDVHLLCEKLSIYGLTHRSIAWFQSFLTMRQQRVQVGNEFSQPETISIGCPQGSLLSPLVFLIYIADLDQWVKNVNVRGYADDTISSISDTSEEIIIKKLEEDAGLILQFMASNFLSANPQKTGFLLIRKSKSTSIRSVEIGGKVIEEEPCHRILGVTINNTLSWKDHVIGKGGLLSAVYQRIGALRRPRRGRL